LADWVAETLPRQWNCTLRSAGAWWYNLTSAFDGGECHLHSLAALFLGAEASVTWSLPIAAAEGVGLRPFDCWDCMDVCLLWVLFVVR
jgi:hypothetical protein